MKKYPNITQKILFKHNDEILVMQHKNGLYDFPGGRVEWGEDLFVSLNRELKEELDYQLKTMPELFHIWNYISKDKKRHSAMIYYIITLKAKPKFISHENLDILWIKEEEMKKIIKDKKFIKKIYLYK